MPKDANSDMATINVSLTFKGKTKVVRHLKETTVSEFTEMYMKRFNNGEPLIAQDLDGIEVGKDLRLQDLDHSSGTTPLALSLKEDDGW